MNRYVHAVLVALLAVGLVGVAGCKAKQEVPDQPAATGPVPPGASNLPSASPTTMPPPPGFDPNQPSDR